MDDFTPYRRPEVKGAVFHRGALWLATHGGLFRWCDDRMQAVPGFDQPLRAVAAAPDGVLVSTGERGEPLVVCDESGTVRRRLPDLPASEAKSVLMQDGIVYAGTKTGIFRLDGEEWRLVHSGKPYEVVGLKGEPGRIVAYVKKQGRGAEPALAVSVDGGGSWRHVYEGSYADMPRAAAGDIVVSQWRGPHRLGETPAFRKEAVTAAAIGAGTIALVGGNKLEVLHGGRCRTEMKHPAFAEAETLLLLGKEALVAGPQGALLVDLATGTIRDLFAGVAASADATKIKKLFRLDGDRLLATASFGTFVSDGSDTWRPSRSDYAAVDAVAAARGPDGAWWLAGQRALFRSTDNGDSWKHVKVAGQPHGFAELTGIAFVAGRMALATKAGLFLSGAGGLKDLHALPALGRRLVEGMVVEDERHLVLAAERTLYRVAVDTGAVAVLAQLPPNTTPIAVREGRLWLVGKTGLFVLNGDVLQPLEALAGHGELHAIAEGGHVIAWRGEQAWLAGSSAADWRVVPDWPAGVKNAAPTGERDIAATDRRTILRRSAA